MSLFDKVETRLALIAAIDELAAIENEVAALKVRRQDARRALTAAKLALAEAEPHPLAGKRVQRSAQPDRKIITQRGTVTLHKPADPYYRGHLPQPGEWFVLSDSGLTAYRLEDRFNALTEWEVVK